MMSQQAAQSWRIAVAGEPDLDEAVAVYLDVFLQDEPIVRSLGIDPVAMRPVARRLAEANFTRGLSLLAREAQGGAVIGFIFCDDLADDSGAGLMSQLQATLRQRLAPALALLERLRAPLKAGPPIVRGQVLHIAAIGTAPAWRGRGLAAALLSRAVDLGGERGFALAVAECSSAASVRCHQRCGFQKAGQLPYATFEHDGTRPFAPLDGDCVLMKKPLGAPSADGR